MTLKELLELKPGDKIRIEKKKHGNRWDDLGKMDKYLEKVLTVKEASTGCSHDFVECEEDQRDGGWQWYPEMIACKEEPVKSAVTKDDERKALAKIRKIVEALGKDSYVGTAFEGAFDLAEQNIDCDAEFSAQWYIDEVCIASGTERALNAKIKEVEAEVDRVKHELEDEKQINKDLRDAANSALEELGQFTAKGGAYRRDIDNLKSEIASLKAKLYDLLMAEKEN